MSEKDHDIDENTPDDSIDTSLIQEIQEKTDSGEALQNSSDTVDVQKFIGKPTASSSSPSPSPTANTTIPSNLSSTTSSPQVKSGNIGFTNKRKKRKYDMYAIANEFQQDYTINCLRRTAPNDMYLPATFLKALVQINYLCKNDSNAPCIKGDKVIESLGSTLGGNVKTSLSTWEDICRMTADPFPLFVSEKDKNETGDFVRTPLYSVGTGFCAAQRYSTVGLSYLGEIACRHYKDRQFGQIDEFKSIVPLALIRKKIMPWTLGHSSMMFSFNPHELFALQQCQLKHFLAAPEKVKKPWMIPENELAAIFKGPDLGFGYKGYITNKSLAALYYLGKGNVTVVPEIKIDHVNDVIRFTMPPLDQISSDFVMHINYRLEGMHGLDKFTTFTAYTECKPGAVAIEITDVDFIGSDSEILDELYSDPVIRSSTLLSDVVMKDKTYCDISDEERALIEEIRNSDVQDAALEDFELDIVPIGELLWHHVQCEYDNRLAEVRKQLEEAREQLEVFLFLEKVTRPGVNDKINDILRDKTLRINDKKMELSKLFYINSPTRDKELLPEGFNDWELREITCVNTKNGRTGLNISLILFERDTYKDMWRDAQAEIDRLQSYIDQPGIIYGWIYDALEEWKKHSEFQRKMPMTFISPVVIEEAADFTADFAIDDDSWRKLVMPCTLYYNDRYLVKSYGRNINFIPNSEEDVKMKFPYALNALTTDEIIVFTPYGFEEYKLSAFPCAIADAETEIKGIVPKSHELEILVIVGRIVDEGDGVFTRYPCSFFVIPPGGPTDYFELDEDDKIIGWCYLNKKYVEFLGQSINDELSYVKIPTEEIPRTEEITSLPETFDIVLDVQATDEESTAIPLLNKAFDSTFAGVDDVVKHWDDAVENSFIILDDNEYFPYFSTHIEFYAGHIYIHCWEDLGIVMHEYLNHGKKSFLPELAWVRPDDKQTALYSATIKRKVTSLRSRLTLVISASTYGYTEYSVAELSDWSLISPAYKMPPERPDNQEVLDTYNEYFDELSKCKIEGKDFKKLLKKVYEAEKILIETTSYVPKKFEDDILVPTVVDTDLSDDDNDQDDDDEF